MTPTSDPAPLPAPAAPAPTRAQRLREGAGVVALTVLLIVGLLEIGLRLFAPQITNDGTVRGPEVRPDLFTGLFVGDPAATYRNTPGFRLPFQQFDEIDTTFTINQQGLREDREIGPPTADTLRILCVGDSFTFGMGVDGNQTFAHLLGGAPATDGRMVDSINAGVNGYGTDNEAAWLDAYGWVLKPQFVLVGFYVGNDVRDVMLGINKTTVTAAGHLVGTSKTSAMLASSVAPAAKPTPATGPTAWLDSHSHAWVWSHGLLWRVFPGLRPAPPVAPLGVFDAPSILLKDEPADIAAGWSKTLALLDQMRAAAAAHGAGFAVLVIPMREQVQEAEWQEMKRPSGLSDDLLERDHPQRRLAAWAAQSGAQLIDVLPAFRAAAATGPLYYRTDPHWNPEGHVLATRLIREALQHGGVLRP
ncbi:MAG TPA: hypothetical protein VM536_08135 [Chloroflexia bacterium]|nr:hypothetical protein [Chloroflexia bacterium]